MKHLCRGLALLLAALLLATPVLAIGFQAEEIYESVFVIYSGSALGSGFALGENCVVTNAHVIEDPEDVTVLTYGGQEFAARVVGMDPVLDIAVLAVPTTLPYLRVADPAKASIGDDIYAIGAPKSMAYTLTKGVISAKDRPVDRGTYLQIDAAINKGNSGGPLLDDTGAVLGMNTLKMTDSEGIGLAIPIDVVCTYLESLGIGLGTEGNVQGRLDAPSETPLPGHTPDATEPGKKQEKKSASPDPITLIACVSLGLNVVLTLALFFRRRKSTPPPPDPRERTDFEIDILE